MKSAAVCMWLVPMLGGIPSQASIVGKWRSIDMQDIRSFHADGSWEARESNSHVSGYHSGTYFFDGHSYLAFANGSIPRGSPANHPSGGIPPMEASIIGGFELGRTG